MGLLTLGMYYQAPIEASSRLYFLIVDAQQNNIAFSRFSVRQGEPLHNETINDQIYKLFEGYFWK